jgi:hypothetical protein
MKSLRLWFVATVVFLSIFQASAQFTTNTTVLVPAGATWKYLDNGTDQGSAWQFPGYDDSGWLSGRAQLGYGDGDEATVVGFGPDVNFKYVTTYFRHAFEVTNASGAVALTVRLLRDDGGIVYVNGVEVFRSNMGGAGTNSSFVNYLTLAATTIPNIDETRFFSMTVNPGLLTEGRNVVAAEVHQASRTSSDMSFDLDLVASFRTGPPVINVQPQNQFAAVGGTATFSVQASGTAPLEYQWYHESERIPDATNPSLRLSGLTSADQGQYWVTVSNALGGAASDRATLTLLDLTGDNFQIATLTTNNARTIETINLTGDDRGGIAVSFGDVLLTGDANTARYNVSDLSGGSSAGIRYDSLCSDLRTGTIYILANGSSPAFSGGMANTLIEVDGETGELTTQGIELSANIEMNGCSGCNGIFSGFGRIVLYNGSHAYVILLPSGEVQDLGPMTAPQHVFAENWAYWGVAEYFNNANWIVYVRDSQTVVRTRVPDGLTAPVATFQNLGDMASFTVSPAFNRWYFHHQYTSQFRSGSETLGYADATFAHDYQAQAPAIVLGPREIRARLGSNVTFNVVATGLPLSYQWQFNSRDIPGATNDTLALTAVGPTNVGLYSVIVSNQLGTATSAPALLNLVGAGNAVTRVATFGANTPSWNEDVRNKIRNTGFFEQVDAFSIGSGYPVPTLEQLREYDAVLVYSDAYFNNDTALGNVLADYVDGGGGLVLATFAFYNQGGIGIQGRIRTGDYMPFTASSQNQPGGLSLVADQPSHPLLEGVVSFSGGSSYHNTPAVLSSGAEIVAHWNNGQPLVTFKERSEGGTVVGLNFYPPSSDANSSFWDARTDGAQLMANALMFSGGGSGGSIPDVPAGIRTQPANQTALQGLDGRFTVSTYGSTPIFYQWYFGTPSAGASPILNATNRTLLLTDLQTNQSGPYFVVVTNAYGGATSQVATLTVRPTRGVIGFYTDYNTSSTGLLQSIAVTDFTPYRISDISTFDFSRLTALLINESSETLTLQLRQRLPAIQEWINRGGRLVVHQRSVNLTTAPPYPLLPGLRNSVFTNAYSYDIDILPPPNHPIAAGPHGALNNSSLDLTDTPTYVAMIGSTLPAGSSVFLAAPPDTNRVVAFAYGLGAGMVYYSSIPLDYYVDYSSASVTTVMRNIYVPNVIEYTTAYTAEGRPIIYSGPDNLEVTAGTTATLTVFATGEGPLQYQWLFNGGVLPGATNNPLRLENVTSANAGQYSLIVSNELGRVTSAAAVLKVVPRLSIAVFDDERYVSTGGGQFATSDAVQAALQQMGHIVRPLTSLLAAVTNDVILFPEFGNRALAPELDEPARTLLRAYVAQGGVMMVQGYYADVDLLNTVFELSLQPNGSFGGINFNRSTQVGGTPFADDPAQIPANSYTYGVRSLPPGALNVYSYFEDSAVALIPYGAGVLVYMGWDWYDGAPLGNQDNGWNQVLASAVQSKGVLPPPTSVHVPLIPVGSVWRYMDNGIDQGVAWRNLAFDDSSWAYGPAQLGYGDGDEATVVSFGPDPNNKYVTTYFRHSFDLASAAGVTNLLVRLLRDDGAAVYLNGVEIIRDCLDNGAGFGTFATCTISGDQEGLFLNYSVDSGLLRTGSNVVAVEIHQANLNSSDISFDLELGGTISAGRPVVRTQPEGRTVVDGSTVVLDVLAVGAQPMRYQWRLNGEVVPGATNAILILPAVTTGQSGEYSVVISNAMGSTTSSNALVNVVTLGGETFRIAQLSTNNSAVVDDSRFAGDTRGGIAASGEQVFYSGDSSTARFTLADLSGGRNLNGVYDALVSDLKTERVYSLATGTELIDVNGGVVTTLVELNGTTGETNGNIITLSDPIDLRNRYGQVALFAGFGRIVIHDGSRAWNIELPSGLVVDLGTSTVRDHAYSENWAFWGVAEFFDGAIWMMYVRDSLTIVRTRVSDGRTETVASFANLGTMSSITVSPLFNRWYFHYTGYSQFSDLLYQGLGFADAAFISSAAPIGPTIVKQPADQTVVAQGSVSLRAGARGTGPLYYQWLFEDEPLLGATNVTLRLSGITTNQAGRYSVIVSNVVSSVTSSQALVTVITISGPTFRITSLTAENAMVADDSILTGDDRGAIAVSGRRIFYSGDQSTAAFDLADLSGGFALGQIYDPLVSELGTETVYALGNGTNVLNFSAGSGTNGPGFSAGTVTALLEVDGVTGELTGGSITLSEPIELTSYQRVGFFAGLGRIVLTDAEQAWMIEIPSGRVLKLGPTPPPTHAFTELGSYWGIAEFFGDTIWLVYVKDSSSIVRTRVVDGFTETVATFNNLGDMAAITVSVPMNRWYFHHQYGSQFGTFYGNIGFADATFESSAPGIGPSILKAPVDQTVGVGGSVRFTVIVRGTGPLTYQWLFEGAPLSDATNATLTLSAVTADQAGRYSVVVSNAVGSITSTPAILRVIPSRTVVVFDDPSYVYTYIADGVQASIRQLGHQPTTFRGFAPPPGAIGPVLFPAFENSDPTFAITTAMRDAWQGFVAGGGVLIVHGAINDPTRTQRFLNAIFGYNLLVAYPQPSFSRTSEADGTAFADDPETLPRNNSTIALQKAFLPVGARSIYENVYQQTVVGLFPFGSGKVIFLGWNWNDAAPVGRQDGGWLAVLSSAIEEATPPAPRAPEVIAQPEDRTVIAGTSVQFRVVASGYPLFYRWLFNGQPVAGGTNFVLQLSNVATNQAGVYSVIVSNQLGSVQSSGALLRVVPPVSVGVFDDPSYVDTTSGSGSAESDNVQATLRQIGHNVRTFTSIPSALTNQVLLFPEFENGDFSFALDNSSRAALQNYVRQGGLVIVQYTSDIRFLNTVFDWSLFAVGGSGNLVRTAEVIGTPFADDPLTLPYNNATQPISTGSLPFGARNLYGDSYQSAMALLSYGAGSVIFMAWDWFSAVPLGVQDGGWVETLNSAVLSRVGITPSPPVITVHPQGQTNLAGLDATFAVKAFGSGSLGVQWFYNDHPIANATNPALPLVSLKVEDSGNYYAVVSNSVGSTTSRVATLLVRPSRGVVGYYTDYNTYFTGPAARIIQAGFTPLQILDIGTFDFSRLDVLLINEPSDTAPSLALAARLAAIEAWVGRGGKLVVHDHSGGFTPRNPFLFGAANTVLVRAPGNDIEPIPSPQNLVVAGPHGIIDSATLDDAQNSFIAYARGDTLPPHALPILAAGTNTTNVVAFSYGLGAGTIYFAAMPLDAFLEYNGPSSWENFKNIYTPNVIEHAVNFTVGGAPAILTGPADTGALMGGNASFTVRAAGQAPLSYQWFFGGAPIPGGTNDTLTLSGVSPGNIGVYTVVVSNPLGSAEATVSLRAIEAALFRILTLTTNSSRITDHASLTGDDRGGIGVSTGFVFYTGDFATARFSADNLGGGTTIGFFDAMVSDLRTETLYTLANGSSLVSGEGNAVTALIEIDGNTGTLSSNRIELSASILLGSDTGIFASYGAVVLHTGGRVYRIEIPSGLVLDLGALSPFAHYSCENWAYWGVAEFFNGAVHLVYVRDSQTIARTRVPDGVTTNLATFVNLGDMCSISVSIARGRWYFHYQGNAQFGGFGETIGYATATFDRVPRISMTVTNRTINEDTTTGPISLNVQDETVNQVVLSASSSNPLLIASSNIVFSGTSISRTVTMTPRADQFGTAIVTITGTDPIGQVTNRTFILTVTPVNDPPAFIASGDRLVSEDSGPQTGPGWATNIVAGPPNESGQALAFQVTSDNPSLFLTGPSVAADGTLTFTPALNANGTAHVTIRLQDNGGTENGGVDISPAQTFSITVTPVNDPPTFTKGPDISVAEDSNAQLIQPWATDIRAGPSDETAQSVAFSVENNNPSLFAVAPAITPDGMLAFTPALNANGAALVTVRLRDNGGTANGGQDTSAPQTFTITVLPVNDPPVANGQSLTVAEDAALAITLSGSDIDSQTLTFSIVTPPAHGTLSGSGASRTYRPATNFVGADSFTFRANDGGLNSAEATVTIEVTPVNDAPFASSQVISGNEDTPIAITLTGSDVEGDALTFRIVKPPALGTLTGAGANQTYLPPTNYFGVQTFTFRANDGQLDSAEATVTIEITAVNDAPVATPQNVSVSAATRIVLSGSDVDGDALTFRVVTPPMHGTLSGTAPTFIYAPTTGYVGPDSFTFSAYDGHAESTPSTVSIDVLEGNRPPVPVIGISPLVLITPESPNGVILSPNNSNAVVILDGSGSHDPDNDLLVYTWFEDPAVPFASGVLATNPFSIGTHTIKLAVSDGKMSVAVQGSFQIISAAEAVSQVVQYINNSALPLNRKNPLLASLQAATASFAQGNVIPGINQLQAFQNKVRAQVAPQDAALAATLLESVTKIIDALQNAPKFHKDNRPRLASTTRLPGNKLKFTVQSTPNQAYIIQTSTDLVHWTTWTNAPSPGGTDQYIDTISGPRRFYRLVTP